VDSLMIVGARLGMNVRICAPYSMWPDAGLADMAHCLAVENGGRFLLTNDVDQGAYGVDFLYSSIWLPGGGERAAWAERVELLSRHQRNNYISQKTENRPCRFMSEAPAPGAGQTIGGWESCEEFGSDGIEIIDEIFKSGCSIMPEADRNRIHAIKAVLVATLAV
jgi:ornithine carbamoyltransferase